MNQGRLIQESRNRIALADKNVRINLPKDHILYGSLILWKVDRDRVETAVYAVTRTRESRIENQGTK